MAQPVDPFARAHTRRGFLGLAGSVALAGLATAACGSDTGRGSSGTSSSSGALQQWYHQYGEAGVEQAVQSYAAAYKTAQVQVGWKIGDYDSLIATALENSAEPDIFEDQVKIDWVRADQVVTLDDIIAPVKDDFTPSVLAGHTVAGHVYGIPQAVDTQVLFYRKSLLQQAGVQPPSTVAELVSAAQALTRNGMKGLFVGNDGGVGVLAGPLLWSVGLDYLHEDASGNYTVGFDDPRAATAMNTLHQLNSNGSLLLGAPADWSDPSAFTQGLTAMQWTGLWNIPSIKAKFGDDFGVLPFPKFDNSGAESVPVGAYGSMINAKSRHIDEAKAFIKWLWIDQTADQLRFDTAFGFHIPSRKSLIPKATNLTTGPAADAVRYVQQSGHLVGGPVWTDAMNTALSDSLTDIAKNGGDPSGPMHTAVSGVQAQLKQLFG
ncbi:MAG TPA: extracellular solute-binding protein [Pseudonocardiaceae bacterium]|nr:extracellular solute-binding protein [Pseudonocardiaceae bacterium]